MTGDALARELAERASESLEPIYVRLDRIAERYPLCLALAYQPIMEEIS